LNEVKGRDVQTYITSAQNVLLRFRTKRRRQGIGFYATYQRELRTRILLLRIKPISFFNRKMTQGT